MTNFSTQKERILQFLEFKGISKNKFYIETGISNGVLDKKSGLSMDTIEKFYSKYPEINPEWLLTGKEEMIKRNVNKLQHNNSVTKSVTFSEETKSKEYATVLNEPTDHYGVGIPLIPIEAMAGFGSGSTQVMDYDTKKYLVPEFTELKVDFMIRIKGDSMYPKYNSGDLVACKKLILNDVFFQWNKVYVLDTEQGALIKRLKKSKKDDCVTLISDNPSYDPFDLHLSKINALAIVVGVIRLE